MWISEAQRTASKSWRNVDVSWEDFLARLEEKFVRTPESMAEYAHMDKSEQGARKSLPGGFVGGRLNGPRRTRDAVLCRTMVTLDADFARAGDEPDGWKHDWAAFTGLYDDLAVACYPTHKSRPDKPRLRWVLPSSREMTPDEYPAVARRVAQWIGIETFDPTTYDVNRLFYYPSVPQDAPYELLQQNGTPLDVDAVLASYGAGEAWKDVSLWPTSSREITPSSTSKSKAADPTTKDGPVGLFCRTYDIPAAIDEFLPDVYQETMTPGRYTYTGGSTAGGAIVYNDGAFLYSNHATDPAQGRSVNAFDLVRIHKFGQMDEGLDEEQTTPSKLPSYKAMIDWMGGLDAIKEQRAAEERTAWEQDFGDLPVLVENDADTEKLPPFIRTGAKGQRKVDPTRLAEWTRRHLRYKLVRDQATDSVRIFVYDGGVYQQYAPEMMLGKIKSFVADCAPELVTMPPVREAYQQIVTDLCYVSQDSLDADEELVNFRNGLLRLSDLILLPHSPDVLSTIQIPCDWTGSPSPTPVFDEYMSTLTNGNPKVAQLLLEVMGVALTNIPAGRMKKALFLVGKGNTGKSQLRLLTERLLGLRLCSSADLSELEARFGTANLYGKRLVGSPDMSFMTVPELRLFKKAAAGDSLSVEFKGLTPFNYVFKGVLWFCMNELPRFGGDDGQWVYDRILPVRCVNVIPADKQDKTLLDKMLAERDGIVYQAIQAARKVIANGYRYDVPNSVTAELAQYQVANNTALSFFESCMRRTLLEEKPSDFCTTSRVYAVYRAWCRTNARNGYAKPQPEFRRSLAAYLGVPDDKLTVHRKTGNFYVGITLTAAAKQEFSEDYGAFADLELRDRA